MSKKDSAVRYVNELNIFKTSRVHVMTLLLIELLQFNSKTKISTSSSHVLLFTSERQ